MKPLSTPEDVFGAVGRVITICVRVGPVGIHYRLSSQGQCHFPPPICSTIMPGKFTHR